MDDIIKNWLLTYNPIKEIARFNIEDLVEDTDSLALQRDGVEDLAGKYVSEKGKRKRYQYMLLLKSESENDIAKLFNYDWLDDLTEWLDNKNISQDFPEIENGIKITKVDCANAITFDKNEDGSIAIYSLQIFVEIYKENSAEMPSL